MRYFMWKSAVLEAAHVSEEDAHRHCGRKRLEMMFDAGEPVWMAAEAVKIFVKVGKRESKADREASYLRSKMKL